MKNNGVSFENDLLQIGMKSKYKKTLGIYFGNKSTSNFIGFSSSLSLPGDLAEAPNVHCLIPLRVLLVVHKYNRSSILSARMCSLKHQSLKSSFNVGGTPSHLRLKLPVMLNKFIESATMESGDFFSRWKQLAGQETQKVFKAKHPIDKDASTTKLQGFGVSVISGIDPNPDNFVSAGVMNTRNMLIGCLLRLEPKKDPSTGEMYRLTVRSSNEMVSKHLCDILAEQF